jgi:methylphosphotriester-DNA--protein-cysteine methyltransferase
MIHHVSINLQLLISKIKNTELAFAGNKKLKIYGALSCSSGKRMKKENRVFFSSEQEALNNGYRPCGHCMIKQYKIWKKFQ